MVKRDVQTDVMDIRTTTEAKTISTISSEGEFPCILIYPDKKHISNYSFAPILDFVKETLGNEGFKVRLLSDETRDLTRYMDEFVRIASDCVYGVVIVDGLRLNVLLDLGILIGINKPFTILKSKDAGISVKTLIIIKRQD